MKNLLVTILLFCGCLITGFSQEVTEFQATQARAELPKSKADTNRVSLFFTIARYHIVKVGERSEDLDTAISFINKGAELSKQLGYKNGTGYSLVLLSMAFREKGLPDKGKEFANMAVEFNRSNNLLSLLGESLLETSQYFDYNIPEESQKKVQLTREASIAFQQDGNIKQEAYCLKHLGDLLSMADRLPEAIIVLKKALVLYNSINYSRLHGTYDLLGALYSFIGDYENGLRYGLMAEKTALQVQDSSLQLCTIYNRIGITYFNLKDDNRAIRYLRKSLAVADRFEDRVSAYIVLGNLVRSYIRIGYPKQSLALIRETMDKYPLTANSKAFDRLTVCTLYLATYIAIKDYENAKQYFNTALELSKIPDIDQRLVQRAHAQIVNFLMDAKQFNRAEFYLKSNHELYKKNNAPTHLARNYLQWYKLDSACGDFASSLAHYQRYKEIEDSLFNLNKSKQFETLTLEFETAKKDQEIKLKGQSIELLTSQAQIRQSELQQSHLIRNSTLIATTLLGVIMLLLYRQYKTKQKSNTVLQHLLTEKEWLLQEVHHRVKNNLQTVLSLLESQAAFLQNNEALSAIQDSQNRIHAMSLIHQKLYQTERSASLNMANYLTELVQYLRESYNNPRISFTLDFEQIELDVSQSIPVGLIVNEAITNSLKYAFPVSKVGDEITIKMKQNRNQVILIIADSGAGLPADFQVDGDKIGLGIKLMKGLTDDIEGKITFESGHGLSIAIAFVANTPLRQIGDSHTMLAQ